MDKICVITGASRGLGFEPAKNTCKDNNICLIARNANELEKAKIELLKLSKMQVLTFAGDISDEAFVKGVFENLKSLGF